MARPGRRNVDYFPHPTTHGKKMYFIEEKFGNDGYATWFKLLEELGNANDHFLDLNDEVTLMYLTSRCKVDETVLIDIISDLVRLGEFNKEFWEEKYLVNEKFLDSIEDAYRKRNSQIINTTELANRLKNSDYISQTSSLSVEFSGNPAEDTAEKAPEIAKEKKSKENKSRVEYEKSNSTDFEKIYEKQVEFYNKEISKDIKSDPDFKSYHKLIAVILNHDIRPNILNKPAIHILKVPNQLTFPQYKKLRAKANAKGTGVLKLIEKWMNNPVYTKGQMSVYATLDLWLDNQGVTVKDRAREGPIIETNIGKH